MLHLTHFSTNCSVVQSSQRHLSLSLYDTHSSIIHKTGGKQAEEWGNMCTRQLKKKAQTLAITSQLMHFTSGHANAMTKPQKKIQQQHLFQLESTYAHPQKSAHPESTEWSYEHFISEHKHFIPTAHVISRS